MLKYVDTKVCFQEVPDEITLCINISNCPCHCKGCHSPYLAEDIGKPLVGMILREDLIEKNKGITCVCFMGGDNDPGAINNLAEYIKTWDSIKHLKVAWYSGRQELAKEIDLNNFDMIKLGYYDSEKGPLNCPTTNQRLYKVINGKMYDYTYLFWLNSNIEVWRDIENFEGYQVSNLGNVRSLNYNGKKIIQNLKPSLTGPNRSYLSVALQTGSKVTRINIHRLVASAFIPNPYNLPEINHKDESGTNNKINNLEWCNRVYNLTYGTRVTRFSKAKSIPILQMSMDGSLIKEWASQTEVCKELGLDLGSLSHCLHGYRVKNGIKFPVYSYAGYKWKYKNETED